MIVWDSSLGNKRLDCVAGKELWPNSITSDLTNKDWPILQVGLVAYQKWWDTEKETWIFPSTNNTYQEFFILTPGL